MERDNAAVYVILMISARYEYAQAVRCAIAKHLEVWNEGSSSRVERAKNYLFQVLPVLLLSTARDFLRDPPMPLDVV